MTRSEVLSRIERLGLLDPTAAPKGLHSAAEIPTLDRLEGKRIGFLDNRKPNVQRLLARLSEELIRRYRVSPDALIRSKTIFSRVAEREVIAELSSHCDAVVVAIGD